MSHSLTAHRGDRYLTVESPYWLVRHDMTQGGCIVEMRVKYGTSRNLLTEACRAQVNRLNENMDPKPAVSVRTRGGRIHLVVRGRMGPGLRYKHVYLYSPWSLTHRLRLVPDTALTVRHLAPLTLTAAGFMTHYAWGTADTAKHAPRFFRRVGAHNDDLLMKWDGKPGVLQEDGARPWAVSFIHRGWEGFQWCGDSKIYQWDRLSPKRAFRLTAGETGLRLELCPVAAGAARMDGPLEFGWTLVLPNVRRLGRPRYNEVAILTMPFPTETELAAWKKSGVNLIRIHEGYDHQHLERDEYWHDGRHPPYAPPKMKALARFIRAVHRHGMKIIPYFSSLELAPDTPLFARHAEDWYSPASPGGVKRYTGCGRMCVYGCWMCSDTGWVKALERNIRAAMDELGFDGFYLDGGGPMPCFNEKHLPGPHNGIDGMQRMLERVRADYPEKIIVIHSIGRDTWLLHHNIADQYVTLEEGFREPKQTFGLDDIPFTADYMGVGVASMVPDILYGKEPKKCAKLYRGLVYAALFGVPPYSYWFWLNKYGYADGKENLKDPRGDFAAMRKYARYDWRRYHFYSVSTGVSACRSRQMGTAVYLGDGEGVLVAGNFTARAAPAGRARVNLGRTPFGVGAREISVPALSPWEWTLIPFRFGKR